jgi:hypothetical protein
VTGRELLAVLLRMPEECMARAVIVGPAAGTDTPDRPLYGVAMTGPDAGILLLTAEGIT